MNNVQATNRLMQIYQAEGEKMISGTEDGELMSAIDYALCALDQTDRTRIRVTAAEKPTEADEYVLGYDTDVDLWTCHSGKYVADNPGECSHWILMPGSPEVTPSETKEKQH